MFFFLLIVPELKFAVYLISFLEKKIILLLIHEKKWISFHFVSMLFDIWLVNLLPMTSKTHQISAGSYL